MGKALIIEGLVVSNPLCVVSFDTQVVSISLNKSSSSVQVGSTDTISANVVTSDGSAASVSFTSSDATIASVAKSGNTCTITALKKGSCTITAKAGSKTSVCSISVTTSASVELSSYYAGNTSITNNDKNALNTMVGSMITNGLWDKVKRFYPVLGNTASDLLLEVCDNSTKNSIGSNIGTYTAQTNSILVNEESYSAIDTVVDSRGIKSDNVCFVTFADISGSLGKIPYTFHFNNTTNSLLLSQGGYYQLGVKFNNVQLDLYPGDNTIKSVSSRYVGWNFSANGIDLWFNGTKVKTYEESIGSYDVNTPRQFMNGSGSTYKMLIVMEHLTDAEMTSFKTIADAFFASTGKNA